MSEDYSSWTACEKYGHVFISDEDDKSNVYRCSDCGEQYEDEDSLDYD